jgi:hypothetical protein
MVKFKSFFYLAFTLLWLPIANAQFNWADAGKYKFNNATNPTILVSVTGNHYIKYDKYIKYNDPNTSYIAKDESGVWENLPGITGTYATLSPFDGTLYQAGRAQQDGNGVQKNQILISEFAWGKWQPINTNGIMSNSNNFKLIISNRDNLYLVYSDANYDNQLAIKRYNYSTSAWEIVGGSEVSTGDVSNDIFDLAISSDEKVVYVSYQDPEPLYNYMPVVIRSEQNGAWQKIGSNYLSATPSKVALALDKKNNIFTAYIGSNDSDPYVDFNLYIKQFIIDGPNQVWQDVGYNEISLNNSFNYSMPGFAIDNQGRVFVAYEDGVGNIDVLMYENKFWHNIGRFTNAVQPSLALGNNNTIYLSYTTNLDKGKIPSVVIKKGVEQ